MKSSKTATQETPIKEEIKVYYIIDYEKGAQINELKLASLSKKKLLDAYLERYMLSDLAEHFGTLEEYCEEFEGCVLEKMTDDQHYKMIEDYLEENYCGVIEGVLI